MHRQNNCWFDFLILFLALIVTLVGIGSYGLYEPHEGHFVMVAQEMLWRNDWITPHLNGSPYLNKPPLLYWLIAISIRIFGSTEFSARLPIGLIGWLGIVIAWKWTRELWGVDSGRVAALMLSVTLGWFIFTHQILIDVLLGTLFVSSNYFLWRLMYRPRIAVEAKTQKREEIQRVCLDLSFDGYIANWLGVYLSWAAGILLKGLIGIVFPLVGCVVLALVWQDWKIIKRINLVGGSLLVLALVLPWFIAVEHANPGFWHYFIVNEHLDRLFDRRFPPDYEVSGISAVGYLAITACWCFPWSLFLPSVIRFTYKECQRGFTNDNLRYRRYRDGIVLLATGAILPVVSFLLPSRLIYYSIPAIPPYIILCAGWWSQRQHHVSVVRQLSITLNRPLHNNIGSQGKRALSPARVFRRVRTQTINLYGAIAIALGIGFYSVILASSTIVSWLPATMQTTETANLIVVVAIALGTGWLTLGIRILKCSTFSFTSLFIVFIITYLAVARGFYLYQDMRSSKNIVKQANICLSADTVWIFEGSREIGAAGAISYYLNRETADNFVRNMSASMVASDNTYRTVMVLADGGKNRLPPRFPGELPKYLITKAQLQNYWNSDRSVAFLTDFLRQPDDTQDPLTLNLPPDATKPYLVSGSRQLYLNQAASKLAERKCSDITHYLPQLSQNLAWEARR